MSCQFSSETIFTIARSSMSRPPNLEEGAAELLASHVESKVRRLIQDARKIARHGKRCVVTTEDVNRSLRMNNLDPILGHADKDPVRFVKAGGADSFEAKSSQKFKETLTKLYKNLKKRTKLQNGEEQSIDIAIDRQADKTTKAIRNCYGKMKEYIPLNTLRKELVDAGVQNLPTLVPNRMYVVNDERIAIKSVPEIYVPKYPLDPSLHMHWLSVDGVQPCISENELSEFKDVLSKPLSIVVQKKHSIQTSSRAGDIHVKTLVKHTLSEEHVRYYQEIRSALLLEDGNTITSRKSHLASLKMDNGLQQLVPYFSKFIFDEITRLLVAKPKPFNVLAILEGLVLAVSALLVNPNVNLEFYMHQLMPRVLSVLLNKNISGRVARTTSSKDDSALTHFDVRDTAAKAVADVCNHYAEKYPKLQSRVSTQYYGAMTREATPLTTHFGAIVGIYWLGPRVVESILMPHYDAYMSTLEQKMRESKKERHRIAARKCSEALKRAAGSYVQFMAANGATFDDDFGLKKLAGSIKEGESAFNDEAMMSYLRDRVGDADGHSLASKAGSGLDSMI
eukprot:g940.t1